MMRETVGRYLFRRIEEIGIFDIFGVPGDFALGLFDDILETKINLIGTCNELNAAYAADGYARLHGVGSLITTYTVGDLSALNGIAGSWAENISVIHISGCPPTTAFKSNLPLHHTLGDYRATVKIFQHVTAASIVVDDVKTAATLIDDAIIKCVVLKKPVFISVCSDIVKQCIEADDQPIHIPPPPVSNSSALKAAIDKTIERLQSSESPIFLPGVGITVYRLQQSFKKLLEKSGIPYATTLLAKTVLSEKHPQHIGIYCGARSRPYVQSYVEGSKCIILLGERYTDFNSGGFTSNIPEEWSIVVNYDEVKISTETYKNVYIHDFIDALYQQIETRAVSIHQARHNCVHRDNILYAPNNSDKITLNRFFDRMASFIPPDAIVIVETGAALFYACEVLMNDGVKFMSQCFYGSIGYTVGACLGVCIAEKNRPVILFVGDGSFQVTCQDISTMIRYNCTPTIFLLNNDGYTIERVIIDKPYNDIQMWKYAELPHIFGRAKTFKCITEGDVEAALSECKFNDELTFIELILDRFDCNDWLRSMGEAMAKQHKQIC